MPFWKLMQIISLIFSLASIFHLNWAFRYTYGTKCPVTCCVKKTFLKLYYKWSIKWFWLSYRANCGSLHRSLAGVCMPKTEITGWSFCPTQSKELAGLLDSHTSILLLSAYNHAVFQSNTHSCCILHSYGHPCIAILWVLTVLYSIAQFNSSQGSFPEEYLSLSQPLNCCLQSVMRTNILHQ